MESLSSSAIINVYQHSLLKKMSVCDKIDNDVKYITTEIVHRMNFQNQPSLVGVCSVLRSKCCF